MKNSRTDHFYIYTKDSRGNYTGNTICVILRDGMMFHGESVCSPKDQFEKRKGRKIAFDRAMHEYKRYLVNTMVKETQI